MYRNRISTTIPSLASTIYVSIFTWPKRLTNRTVRLKYYTLCFNFRYDSTIIILTYEKLVLHYIEQLAFLHFFFNSTNNATITVHVHYTNYNTLAMCFDVNPYS